MSKILMILMLNSFIGVGYVAQQETEQKRNQEMSQIAQEFIQIKQTEMQGKHVLSLSDSNHKVKI